MIDVCVRTGADGWLQRVEAFGHARRGSDGASIPCAVASSLLRTASTLLTGTDGIRATGSAPREGRLSMRLEAVRRDCAERAVTITDFLMQGLRDLEADYPQEITIRSLPTARASDDPAQA